MEDHQYRLSKKEKSNIAQNLIDILQKDSNITEETFKFINEWIMNGPKEKVKAHFDVWDIVLKNYLPTTRPILFRTCGRISKNRKIASFTGKMECIRQISKGKGALIICDTEEHLKIDEEFHTTGMYKHTFYPLVSVLIKARDNKSWGFSKSILIDYIKEDEYIMRIDLGNMNCFRWLKND